VVAVLAAATAAVVVALVVFYPALLPLTLQRGFL
jgi:hypothetical protein